MSLPRSVSLVRTRAGLGLRQRPVAELKGLRRAHRSASSIRVAADRLDLGRFGLAGSGLNSPWISIQELRSRSCSRWATLPAIKPCWGSIPRRARFLSIALVPARIFTTPLQGATPPGSIYPAQEFACMCSSISRFSKYSSKTGYTRSPSVFFQATVGFAGMLRYSAERPSSAEWRAVHLRQLQRTTHDAHFLPAGLCFSPAVHAYRRRPSQVENKEVQLSEGVRGKPTPNA